MKLFEKISDQAAPPPNEQVKIFGINFYEKYYKNGKEVKKFLYNIFKIIQLPTSKSFYLMGIKIFYKKYINKQELNLLYEIIGNINFTRGELKKYLHNIIQETVIEETRMANAICQLHSQVFPKFKNCHKNQSLAIIGTGPTLVYYEFVKDLVHVGLNKAFLAKNIKKLNYSFAIDYFAVKNYIKELKYYDCIKFLGMQANINLNLLDMKTSESTCIPEKIVDEVGAIRFYADAHRKKFFPNIETCPLMDRGSIAFPALHFSLYTAPKRIFLIGCDTKHNGYYDGTNDNSAWLLLDMALDGYIKFKSFVKIYYPDIEIISVNPIGLRGIFRDVYTKSYVTDNPELFIGLEDKIEYFEDIV